MLPACSTCGELGHRADKCRQMRKEEDLPVDFDQAGQDLLERMGALRSDDDRIVQSASPTPRKPCLRGKGANDRPCRCARCFFERRCRSYSKLNAVWRGSSAGGTVYVGSLQAAKDEALLDRHGISHIVNCMNQPFRNIHSQKQYFDFNIEKWRKEMIDLAPPGHPARPALAHESFHGLALCPQNSVLVQ